MPVDANLSVWRIEIAVPRDVAPAIAETVEVLCTAVSWTVPDEDEDDEARDAVVTAYAPEKLDPTALLSLLETVAEAFGIAVPKPEITREEPRDWIVETEARFPPVDAGRFHIMGSHVPDAPLPGRIALRVDAGRAFGSGEHGSTRGCLLALEGLAHRPQGRILDMGCGSGILSLAAARLWRAPILACDIDPKSVAVTRVNARRNGVGGCVRALMTDGYRNRTVLNGAPYDLILANILARPLMRMAKDLGRHLAPGGVAVLSGFVARDAMRVLAAHRAAGLRLQRRIDTGGWVALVVGK